MEKQNETTAATYTVERVDGNGRIITGYRHDIEAATANEALELWHDFYAGQDFIGEVTATL